MSAPPQLKGLLVPVILVLILLALAAVFPVLGVLVGVISPVPLILIYLKQGKPVGLASVALVMLVILVLMGGRHAMFFVAEYAVMAVVMAETIRLGFPYDRSILFSALGSAALSGLLIFLFFANKDITISEFFNQQIQENFNQSIETLEGMGKEKEELEAFKSFVNRTSGMFAASYPAFILVGSLLSALVNYTLVRFFFRRLFGESPYFTGTLTNWVLPDYFIWMFILSAASFFLPEGELRVIGLNAFIMTLVFYFLQGLAVVVHFLETKSVPLFLWVVAIILIFSQPILIGFAIGLGLFDLWVDFRKLRPKAAAPTEDENDNGNE